MAVHEYGSPVMGIPSRSALRMPLTDHLPKKLEEGGLFEEEEAREVLRTGTLTPWMKRVAMIAVGLCKESFTNDGWGKWEPLDDTYSEWKDQWYGTGQILVASGQLRDSITDEVMNQ